MVKDDMTQTGCDLRILLRAMFVTLVLLFVAFGCFAYQDSEQATGSELDSTTSHPVNGEWQSMFDGKSLQGWNETQFPGRGKVHIEEGTIVLDKGAMTGITWAGTFPKSNYEVRLEAARLNGHDFFAGITFPVKESFCSWISGGWGGRLVGLSSLDGYDASENETQTLRDFENGKWYVFLLRVGDDRIQAWIDNDPVIDVDITDREISLRPGAIKLSAPFGIASYSTTGALRKLQYRLMGKGKEPPN